jgi:predicted permease
MSLPRYARIAVRLTYPSAERQEVLVDLDDELTRRRATRGWLAAQLWLFREIVRSTPSLLLRGVWRGSTGFESTANAMRPGGAPLEGMILDARFAVRRLRSRPLYAVLTVLTLALGVGGAAAIYAITRAFLVDPLPYADESRLVIFSHPGDWTEEEFLYLRDKRPGFSGLAAYRPSDATLTLDDAPTQLVHDAVVSSDLFDVLGVRPFAGRTFAPGEDALNAPAIAVISYGFWQELGGDASAIGRRIITDGTARTIVGIMPRHFWFPDPDIRMWVPGPFDPASRVGNYWFIARVSDDSPIQASLAQFSKIIRERFTGEFWPGWLLRPLSAVPVRDFFFSPLRPALLATLVAMGCIMLIACANVAALMLGQIEGRAVELAVRAALGANRTRIAQQIILESLGIGALAAILGAAIAAFTFRVLVTSLPLGALSGSVTLDYRVFAAAVVIAIVAAVIISVIPISALWRDRLRDSLVHTRTSGVGGGSRVAGALVVGEVAIALVMTAGAGLLGRSVSRLYDIEAGVSRSGLAVIELVTPASLQRPDRQQLMQRVMTEISGIASVTSVSMTQRLPLRQGWTAGLVIPGHPEIGRTGTVVRIVAPRYFETMGIRVLRGRGITGEDVAGAEPAVVINQKLADLYFHGEDPIGKEIATGFGAMGRIVGIVHNVKESALTDSAKAVRYLAYVQVPFMVPMQSLVVRTTGDDAERHLPLIQSTIHHAAPSIAIQNATTMSKDIDRAVGPARQVMFLLGLLTSLALTLGAIGIYGVVAQFVRRRGREWAIRMALGLSPGRVVRYVLSRGSRLVAIGVVIGLAGTLIMAKLVRPFLYGISSGDPAALTIAIGTLVLVGIAASAIPAYRAARVDPAIALREQ